MTLFELQLSLFRAWTDTAQAMLKVGAEAAATITRSVEEATPKPLREAVAPFNALMPFAALPKANSAWPLFPMQAFFPGVQAASADPFTASLQLFSPRAWSMSGSQTGWPFAGHSWFSWPGLTGPFGMPLASATPFANWPMGFVPNPMTSGAMWPIAFLFVGRPVNPFAWPQPGFTWPTALPDVKTAWPFMAIFDAFKLPSAGDAKRSQSVSDSAKSVSFRTSSGHAAAAVVTSPVDIARSIASFWALDTDPPARKH